MVPSHPSDCPVLVTGGAGYIGAQAVLALHRAGFPVVVLDDLSTGMAANLPDDVALEVGNCGDDRFVPHVLARYGIRAAMHFAGSIIVSQSVSHPLAYYGNNTANSRRLITACVEAGLSALVFSSTAAVYGEPAEVPVSEASAPAPINPLRPLQAHDGVDAG